MAHVLHAVIRHGMHSAPHSTAWAWSACQLSMRACTTAASAAAAGSTNGGTNGGTDGADWRAALGKVLVANRGEIACRVLTTCRRLGIPTVAVYSDADATAQHVAMADECVRIGAPPSAASYLNSAAVLAAAAATGARSLHPGYGFLSENAEFVTACQAAGINFIGPPAAAMAAMGNKSAAKTLMLSAGVAVVPGYHGDDQSLDTLMRESRRIGYPLLVKAVFGGGGKGMKLVRDDSQLKDALEAAAAEAAASFGDGRVLVERYIERPRHIEVQIIADDHDHVLHLSERDCSMQRRHQKVIEEAPAWGMSQSERDMVTSMAVAAARAVSYRNAGTVEFIFDMDTKEAFFMEMNTRLQVEHPVTEMVTGVDLVELQLRVAAGLPLSMTQADVAPRGHAIEARLYAESPADNFMPGAGRVALWRVPQRAAAFTCDGEWRVDSGVRSGDDVGVLYDPMIAKVVARSRDRTAALDSLHRLLSNIQVAGLQTNTDMLIAALQQPTFRDQPISTAWLPQHLPQLLRAMPQPTREIFAVAALARWLYSRDDAIATAHPPQYNESPAMAVWRRNDCKRLYHPAVATAMLCSQAAGHSTEQHGTAVDVALTISSESDFTASIGTEEGTVKLRLVSWQPPDMTAEVNGRRLRVTAARHDRRGSRVYDVWADSLHYVITENIPQWSNSTEAPPPQHGIVVAPMPGRIVKVLAQHGSMVQKGATVVVMEAMKMQHALKAASDGELRLFASEGQQVQDGQNLFQIVSDNA